MERELDLERELDRERGRQRERQMEFMREESMLQSMLSRRRGVNTQVRAEDPDTFATISLPDPDARFRRIVSSSFPYFSGYGIYFVPFRWNPP